MIVHTTQNEILPTDEPRAPGENPEKFDPMDRYVGVGRAGNTGYWGYALTGETVNKLDNGYRQGLLTYDQMRRSDSQIKSILQAIGLPILSAHYHVEPASKSPMDVKIAQIIEDSLLQGMQDSWVDTMRHALLMLPFGFSYLEKIYRYRGGLALPFHLAPRLPLSIYRWMATMDTARLYEIWQLDSNGRLYKIPVEKLVMFVNEREGDNWVGTSLLRPAYKNWTIKTELEKIDAIKHERHGVGVPVITPREGSKPNDREWVQAEALVAQYMASESSGVVLPYGYKMEILTPGSGGGTDILPTIQYHNEEIARSVLAMFVSLGNTQTGSRALGETFLHIFMDSIQWVADYICARITQDVVKETVRMNWGDVPYPTLKCARIEKLPTDTIAAMAGAGLITPDMGLEDMIRKSLKLPEKTMDEQTNTAGDGETEQVAATKTVGTGGTASVGKADVGLSHKHGAGCGCGDLALGGKKIPQAAIDYAARFIDIPGYALQLSSAEQSLEQKVMQIREMQIRSIARDLLAGKKLLAIKVPLKKELYNILSEAYHAQRAIGAAQVKSELSRQGNIGGVRLAESKFNLNFLAISEDEIILATESAANKMLSTASETFLEGKRLGLDGSELAKYLSDNLEEDIGTKTFEDLAKSTIGRGWNDGREEEARALTEDGAIETAHYSCVFDSGLCAVCEETYNDQDEAEDGTMSHAPGDARFTVPNPECMGGTERCRCINIYISGKVFQE